MYHEKNDFAKVENLDTEFTLKSTL